MCYSQAAVYGVGVCSEFGGSAFRPLVGGNLCVFLISVSLCDLFSNTLCEYCLSAEALCRLNNVMRHPNALDSDNVMAYDNAVSALGKICQFHRDSIDAAQVFQNCFCMYICTFPTKKH